MYLIRLTVLLILSSVSVSNLGYASEKITTIKVVNSGSWSPFSFIGEDGKPKGILYDLWTEIGVQQGIKVEFINTKWSHSLEMMRSGEADVHAGLFQSSERDQYLDFSIPIRIPIATRLFVSSDLNIDGLYDIGDTQVGVIRGGFSEGFIKRNYSSVTTKSYAGTTELLEAAISGEVQAFASDYAAAMYYLHKGGAPTAFSAVETLYMERLRAAVAKGNKAELALINKALLELPEEDFDRIVNKWIQSDSQIPEWVLPSFLLSVVLIATIFVMLYILLLKRQVQSKTRELQALSEIDSLTKVFNRKKFEHCFECEMKRYRHHKITFSLILMDVDNFKGINDTYGHMVGDEILVKLVDLLKQSLRQSDLLARWGGDEFTILCIDTDGDAAVALAKTLQGKISAHSFEFVERCTMSMGVTQVQEQDQVDSIFARADKALYKSKEEGKNTVTYLSVD